MSIEQTLNKLDEHTANAKSIYAHFSDLYFSKHCLSFHDAHEATHKAVLEWYDQRDKVFDRYANMLFINHSNCYGGQK